MQQLIEWNYWGVSFLGVFVAAWLLQVYFMLNYFMRIARFKPSEESMKPQAVSVVISARNEERNLMEFIPQIMDQDHPNFEVVVVNDSSWDDTEAILKALHVRYPHMHVINLDEEKQNMQGKKFALTLGIKAAKHDLILLTDADCAPKAPSWIREMTAMAQDKVQLVLGFSPYKSYPGWLNKIIRFDTLNIGLTYLGFAKAGNPYMGVGRNLCYSRELFFSVGGFKSHYSMASGDDDLFVNQVATSRNTDIVISPEAQTVSEPKRTWKEWFVQKRRHFVTAPLYKSSHKQALAIWPFSFFFLYVGFAGALVFKTAMLVVGSMLFVRYVLHVATLHKSARKLGQSTDIVFLAPLLEIQLHFLNAGLYLINLVRKPQKWN